MDEKLRLEFCAAQDHEACAAAKIRLIDAGVCDTARAEFPEGRRRILVIEPHCDDAILSLGGTMWLRREECEFVIATLGSRSNFTSYYYQDRDFFNLDTVSALRAAEGAHAARLIGGRYITCGLAEVTQRYRPGDWTLDWYRQHQFSVRTSIGRRYSESDLGSWADGVRKVLAENASDEVWMPIGVGLHCDHQLTRDACLTAILEAPSLVHGRTVRFYEEVPYGAYNPAYSNTIVDTLMRAGARLVPEIVPVDSVFKEKLRLVSVFASQFKLVALQPRIEACGRHAGGGTGLAERLWRVDRFPDQLDRNSLRIDAGQSKARASELKNWFDAHRRTKHLRLLMLLPSGRWAQDARFLLESFPDAVIDVHVTADGVAEMRERASQRIRTHRVGKGMRSWLATCLKLAVNRPAPTIFVTGQKRLRAGKLLSRLWPLCDPRILISMDDLLAAAEADGAQIH